VIVVDNEANLGELQPRVTVSTMFSFRDLQPNLDVNKMTDDKWLKYYRTVAPILKNKVFMEQSAAKSVENLIKFWKNACGDDLTTLNELKCDLKHSAIVAPAILSNNTIFYYLRLSYHIPATTLADCKKSSKAT